MKCENCGKELKEGMTFCPYCGAKVERELETIIEKFSCPNCQTEMELEMKYCPQCGYEVANKMNDVENKVQIEDKTTYDNEKYCVVITDIKNGPIPLIKLIHKTTGLDIAASQKLASKLPLPLFLNLSKEEANSIKDALEKEGIIAIVQEASSIVTNETIDDVIKSENNDSYDEEKYKKKRKLNVATIVNVVSSALLAIAIILMLFLPMFTIETTEIINEESVVKESSLSLVGWIIDIITSVFSSNGGLYFLSLTLYVLVIFTVGTCIASSVKKIITNVKHLIRFEEYYNEELSKTSVDRLTEETVKSIKGTNLGPSIIQVIGSLFTCFIVSGFNKIIFGTVITVIVITFISWLLELAANWIKKSIK